MHVACMVIVYRYSKRNMKKSIKKNEKQYIYRKSVLIVTVSNIKRYSMTMKISVIEEKEEFFNVIS